MIDIAEYKIGKETLMVEYDEYGCSEVSKDVVETLVRMINEPKRDELAELRDYLFGKLMNNNGTMLAGEFEAYKDIADKVERMIAERK